MGILNWLFGEKASEGQETSDEKPDAEQELAAFVAEVEAHVRAPAEEYVKSCFHFKFKELEDSRWFSHFDELPKIDSLFESGKYEQSIALAMEGLKKHPDSFLFYCRAGKILDAQGRSEEARMLYFGGLEKSLSKMNICESLGDRALEQKDYREAVFWWIRACVLQIESGMFGALMPFLNLAHFARGLGMKYPHEFLLRYSDRIAIPESGRTVRFDSEGADLRYDAAEHIAKSNDDAIPTAIDTLLEYGHRMVINQVGITADKDIPVNYEPLFYRLIGEDDDLSSEAAKELINIGTPIVEYLIRIVNNRLVGVWQRKHAMYALGRIGDVRAVDPLSEIIFGYAQGMDKRERVRREQGLSEDEHLGLFREAKEALETMGYELQ